MSIVVRRLEEELLLATCDGTCSNAENCKCIIDIGTQLAGQAMYDYGFITCVLCQRANGQEYNTIPDNYPESWIYDGCKIKYDKGDYKVSQNDLNSIEQVIDETKENLIEESWLSSLYYTSTELVDTSVVDWKLAVCETQKCKCNVHAYIDVHRAIGVSSSYYDVSSKVVKCELCHSSLKYIPSDDGVVVYNDQKFIKCRFCSTIIFFQENAPVQLCTTCTKKCQNDVQKSRHICLYCKNSVNVAQRKNIQEFKIRKTPTSHVETVYLCRLHRIYPPDPTKIFKISELLSMF